MNILNYTFFEEYKQLEKLCTELYGEQHGVSHYIDDMKYPSGSNYRHIPNWNADLQQLIRLRHIRNRLAHTEGAFDESMCTQKDIEWCQDFYKRILDQSDPLTMLHRYSKKVPMSSPVTQSQSSQPLAYYNAISERTEERITIKRKKMNFICWIIFLLFIIGIIFLVIISIAIIYR